MGHLVRTLKTESAVCIGDVYEIGAARFRYPSHASLAGTVSLAHQRLAQQTGRTGWYFRGRHVESNLSLILVERPFSQWTIARANTYAPPAQ